MKGVRIDGSPTRGAVVEDPIALEAPINLYINDSLLTTLFATPCELRELAIGHLLGEGVIESPTEVDDIIVDGSDVLLYIKGRDVFTMFGAYKAAKVIYSSCGSVENFGKALESISRPRVSSDFTIDADKLVRLVREMAGSSPKQRIAVHTAALYDAARDSLRFFTDDVSRHVTVDKVVGKAALAGVDFSRTILITTGRQASDMVLKAARVGIPITVSLRGPLFSGVYAAMKTGVTMVSIAHGRGLTAYANPARIIIP